MDIQSDDLVEWWYGYIAGIVSTSVFGGLIICVWRMI